VPFLTASMLVKQRYICQRVSDLLCNWDLVHAY
jgi:hypothetical protein